MISKKILYNILEELSEHHTTKTKKELISERLDKLFRVYLDELEKSADKTLKSYEI